MQRKLPIFVAPYVLSDYGEGALMGVPGHDSRDMAFFKENVNPDSIPIVIEAEPSESDRELSDSMVSAHDAKAFTQDG